MLWILERWGRVQKKRRHMDQSYVVATGVASRDTWKRHPRERMHNLCSGLWNGGVVCKKTAAPDGPRLRGGDRRGESRYVETAS